MADKRATRISLSSFICTTLSLSSTTCRLLIAHEYCESVVAVSLKSRPINKSSMVTICVWLTVQSKSGEKNLEHVTDLSNSHRLSTSGITSHKSGLISIPEQHFFRQVIKISQYQKLRFKIKFRIMKLNFFCICGYFTNFSDFFFFLTIFCYSFGIKNNTYERQNRFSY